MPDLVVVVVGTEEEEEEEDVVGEEEEKEESVYSSGIGNNLRMVQLSKLCAKCAAKIRNNINNYS